MSNVIHLASGNLGDTVCGMKVPPEQTRVFRRDVTCPPCKARIEQFEQPNAGQSEQGHIGDANEMMREKLLAVMNRPMPNEMTVMDAAQFCLQRLIEIDAILIDSPTPEVGGTDEADKWPETEAEIDALLSDPSKSDPYTPAETEARVAKVLAADSPSPSKADDKGVTTAPTAEPKPADGENKPDVGKLIELAKVVKKLDLACWLPGDTEDFEDYDAAKRLASDALGVKGGA